MTLPGASTSGGAEGSAPADEGRDAGRAAAGSFVGGVVEFYDFFIYGAAAALILNDLFFPDVDPAAGTLAALATFAAAYVVRPLGGVIFGHIGDRVGRKATLVATLMLMGFSTFLIGCLPTYAVLGPWAAVILVVLRIAQGLAAGGELGGASALAVEHAPPRRRGFFGAFATAGTSGGVVLGSAVFALVSALPADQFASWGWRIPFLLSAVVIGVGVVVRRRIPEPSVPGPGPRDRAAPDTAAPGTAAPGTPSTTDAGPRRPLPLLGVLRRGGRELVVSVAVFSAQIIVFYLVTVYSLTYAARLGPGIAPTVLTAITIAGVVNIVAMLVWGAVSDRVGRRPVLVAGMLAQAVFLFVFFSSLSSGSFALILGATVLVLGFGQTMIVGVAPAFFSEMFDRDVRCTGVSMGMQLASVLGGLVPLVAAALAARGQGWAAIAWIAVAFCVVASVGVLAGRETAWSGLNGRPEVVAAGR